MRAALTALPLIPPAICAPTRRTFSILTSYIYTAGVLVPTRVLGNARANSRTRSEKKPSVGRLAHASEPTSHSAARQLRYAAAGGLSKIRTRPFLADLGRAALLELVSLA